VDGTNSAVSVACASNRYSVAFTMSTIGCRRAFDSIFAQYRQSRTWCRIRILAGRPDQSPCPTSDAVVRAK
jgi:hypothetical protein